MACDAGYLPYAFCLAASIDAMHPGRGFDIGLVSEDPVEVPSHLTYLRLRTWRLERPNPFTSSPNGSRHGAATYLRLLVPDLLASDYDRLLYLDSDVLCTGPGLDKLLEADMGRHWLAAVRDNTQWRTPSRRLAEFRAVGRPARPYFNGGVLMIDVAGWRAEQVEARALAMIRSRPDAVLRHDQSILNLIADGHWAEMSPVWNWQYTWSSRFFAELCEPRLVHFIGPRKPWTNAGASLPVRYRRVYGMVPEDADAFIGSAWPPDLRRSLLKHWAAMPAMARYLSRFTNPLRLVTAS